MTVKEFKIQYALGSLSNEMKKKLAEDLKTSKEILTILSKDKHWSVRYSVARNPNTLVEVHRKLSKDENWFVRNNVCILFED